MRLLHRTPRSLVVSALLLPLACAAAHAQYVSADCGVAVKPNVDVSIHLSLDKGQRVFRQGEIVGFDAEYSVSPSIQYSTDPGKDYVVNTRTYDRSGRLNGMETFCVDPEKGTDPLADYALGLGGLGGMFGVQGLNRTGFHMHFDLNEWKTLPPGSYRLSIISQRVALASEGVLPGIGAAPLPTRSDTVAFEVVAAEPKWQAEQLAAADQVLDAQGASVASDAEKEHAARVLRFLGSEAATRNLARRYWASNNSSQPLGWEMAAGLYRSPYRATAIQAMKDAIKDPQHPVTRDFVDTLTRLELMADPKYRLPKFDAKNREASQAAWKVYNEEFSRREGTYLSEMMAAAPAKMGEARAITLSEILLLPSSATMTSEEKGQLRKMLLESWPSLPVAQQNDLMWYRWEQVGGPEWLPLMLSIATSPPKPTRRIDTLERGAALQRVYEMSPEKGRELMLKEIGEANGDIWADVLELLPDRELPQFDAGFVGRLKPNNGRPLDFQLLDRYASAAVLPQVQAMWEGQRDQMNCGTGTSTLRYFLRVSPEYGVEQAESAVSEKQSPGNCPYQMRDFKDYIRLPKLEQFAIDALNDPSLSLERNAVDALQQYGSARAEAPLWARLEKLHEKWKDRPLDEFHPHPEVINQPDEALEYALMNAITKAQGWFVTQGDIDRLRGLSSTASQTSFYSIEQALKSQDIEVGLSWFSRTGLRFNVAWYDGDGMAALKEKLTQLPAGSHLKLSCSPEFASQHKAELDEVVTAAKANGQSLEMNIQKQQR